MKKWQELTKEEIDALTDEQAKEMLDSMTEAELDELLDQAPEEAVEKLANALGVEDEPASGGEEEVMAKVTEQLEEQKQRTLKLEEALAEANKRLAQADHEKFVASVGAIMARAEAYRDKDGRAHPKILLDTARSLLLNEPVKSNENVIVQLEEGKEPTVAAVCQYVHKAVVFLLENLPGLVPTQTMAPLRELNPGGNGSGEAVTDDDMKAFEEHTGVKSVVLEEGK